MAGTLFLFHILVKDLSKIDLSLAHEDLIVLIVSNAAHHVERKKRAKIRTREVHRFVYRDFRSW